MHVMACNNTLGVSLMTRIPAGVPDPDQAGPQPRRFESEYDSDSDAIVTVPQASELDSQSG